jgi:type I restriction enzyme, S subunit
MIKKWLLPFGWEWSRLGDLCETTSGGTPSRRNPAYYGGSIAWVKSGELPDGIVTRVEEYITEEAVRDSNAKIFPVGTLLIAMYGATVGKLGILGMDAATNQAVCAIFPPTQLDRDYLFWFLKSIRPELVSASFGGAQPNISQSIVRGVEIPVPYSGDPIRSLETQSRIVARIEALFIELREARRLHAEIVADTGRVMEAAIREVFDSSTDGWQTHQLSEVATIQTGTAKGRNFGDRKTVELPYLRVANVQAGRLDLDEIKTIRIAQSEIDRYRLQPGDLLLTEGGDFDKLGRGAVWNNEIELCVHQNHIFAVRFNQDIIQPEFVEYEMLSWHAKRYFLGVAKKTTNLATINSTQLAAFPMKFPELPAQRRIVAHLDTVKQQSNELQAIQRQNEALLAKMEQSIFAQAFRGEL